MSGYACPICLISLPPNPRHPRYVCATCADRASTSDGRVLAFGNEGLSGGYLASVADTGEPYDSHACWIGGVACHADEARFGGIVIEVVASGGARAYASGTEHDNPVERLGVSD